jgi:hypothetical protein
MDCEHDWKSGQVNLPNQGYMLIKFCQLCKAAEGLGFIDKEHELQYLESLLEK